eukprot:353764-Chlamydomonas_euryale.AAC.3
MQRPSLQAACGMHQLQRSHGMTADASRHARSKAWQQICLSALASHPLSPVRAPLPSLSLATAASAFGSPCAHQRQQQRRQSSAASRPQQRYALRSVPSLQNSFAFPLPKHC